MFKTSIQLAIAIIISVMISFTASSWFFKKGFKAQFDAAITKKMEEVNSEPPKREESKISAVGKDVYLVARGDFTGFGVRTGLTLEDVGANSRMQVALLNPSSVILTNIVMELEIAVKQTDGTVKWESETISAKFEKVPPSTWTYAYVDIPNRSVKELSSVYVKSIKTGGVTAVL